MFLVYSGLVNNALEVGEVVRGESLVVVEILREV